MIVDYITCLSCEEFLVPSMHFVRGRVNLEQIASLWQIFSPLRVTGKMVGTASHESVQAGTKLLDIPLNPENNMTALWVEETFPLQKQKHFICVCNSASYCTGMVGWSLQYTFIGPIRNIMLKNVKKQHSPDTEMQVRKVLNSQPNHNQLNISVADSTWLPWTHLWLNKCCSIDCAGILKLRNSDIELRKGETDVGRKNTRVRLVFRTHLPLAPPVAPPSRVLALQVASLPIECCEWSIRCFTENSHTCKNEQSSM